MHVQATLTCKSCGSQINLKLRGNSAKMSEHQIGQRVLAVASARHDCPAVTNELDSHLDKYFGDLRRGMEKKHEIDHKLSLAKGNDGKFIAKA